MITLGSTQFLHLKLDRITNGQVVDSSGQSNHGTIQVAPAQQPTAPAQQPTAPAQQPTAPQIVPDTTLGSCLSLNGSNQYINLPAGSIPTGKEITVSFWAYGGDALPKNSAIIEATDANGLTTLSIRLPWSDSTVYFGCGNDGTSTDSITQAAQPTDFKGAWTYWAFTKSATNGTMYIYRNGFLWQSGTGKTKPLPASTMVRLGATVVGGNYYYPGQIAQVRIYNQALTVDAIMHDMEADQTALSSFRKSYPIDFRLYNDDQQDVIAITDDPAGQNLHLEISNASAQVINLLAPSNATASSSNYHFALKFRPGVLSSASQQTQLPFAVFAINSSQTQTTLTQAFQAFMASSQATSQPVSDAVRASAINTASVLQGALQQLGWSPGFHQDADGSVTVYFLSTKTDALQPGEKRTVIFPNLSASGTGGARGTRVELLYQQLTFGSDLTPVQGRRQIHLSVVNERGQKAIPLHVGFVGFNTILNDGITSNSLTLRITNVLENGVIALNTNSSAPSMFIFSFDVDKDWALGTTGQVSAIGITPNDLQNWIKPSVENQGESPQWTVTPKSSKTTLAAGEALQLTIDTIVSSSPSGQTNLYVRYENIPGYWDGQFVVPIEKTPLLARGSNVGIGTNNPDRPLSIIGSGGGSELISFKDATGATKWHINQNLQNVPSPGLNIVETGVFDGRLFIQKGGNVGISTTQPKARLEVNGSDYQLAVTNQQNHSWGLVNWTDDNLYFQYREAGVFKNNALRLDKNGNLTIDGTASISGAVSIGGTLSIGPHSLEQDVIVQTPTITPGALPRVLATPLSMLTITGDGGGRLATKTGLVLTWLSGQVLINGTFSAQTKNFLIDHPTKPDHNLVHACLEGPEAAVYYRGEAQLEHGRATIHLPDYFEALTRKAGRTVVLTPKGREPFLLSYEDIVDGTFRVYGTSSDGEFSWEVKAVRADVGRLEVEVRKEVDSRKEFSSQV
jgi:Concanavalin A-like lectin/glucanases superfamily